MVRNLIDAFLSREGLLSLERIDNNGVFEARHLFLQACTCVSRHMERQI